MLIGIDGNEANQINLVGIGNVALNVILQLEKNDHKNEYLVYLNSSPLSDLPKEREGWRYKVFGPKKLWTQIALPVKLFTQKDKLTIFFSPSHYAPRFCPVPSVIYLMDLWHHRHPEQFNKKDLFQLTKWEGYSVKKAKHILTISEFSKREILDVYKIPENKVTVAYPGFNQFKIQNTSRFAAKFKIDEIKNKYGIKGDYLLYIGTLQPKKNIEGLIKAFGLLNSNLSLVVAGKKGWLYEKIFELVKELKLENKVIFTGFVSEEEKPYLIFGATAFVLVSFYEGFGIPVLEAMSFKVPVVLSKEGSLPEVGGEAAIYCNPYDTNDIGRAIEEVLSLNKAKRDEIIKKGLDQTKKFSWEKCAGKILETLEGVANYEK